MDIAAHSFDLTAPTAELTALASQAAQAYYGTGDPIMSDDAFDAITAELARRGETERVGHGATGGKVKHSRPMLSLRKVHEVSDLEALVAGHPGAAYTVEPKWDGLAVSVRYGATGRIISAAKRGDGVSGEDITPAIRAIFARQGIPDVLDLGAGEVRGEIVMTRSAFKTLNDQRTGGGFAPLKNPRNAAAGMIARVASAVLKLAAAPKATAKAGDAAIALTEAAEEAGKWLTFLAYDADTYGLTDRLVAAAQQLSALRLSGPSGVAPFVRFLLPTAAHGDHAAGLEAAVAWLKLNADDLDVDTDGVVVKFSDPVLRAELGESSTAPRWALAYKYPNRPKLTTLRGVEWAETRTGRVVPTAIFDPVELAGATVNRATLNNAAFLGELDVWIGDSIEVTRANEVIPNIVRRVGEHAEDAKPVLDPNGWPVGPIELVDANVSVASTSHWGPLSGVEVKFQDSTWVIPVAQMGVVSHSLPKVPAPVYAAVLTWARGDRKLPYRRDGRDFVHDSGNDPVKDVSFAAKTLDILGLGEDVVRRLLGANPHVHSFPTLLEACREGSLVPFERGTQKLVTKIEDEVLAKTSGPQDPAKWVAAAGIPMIGRRLSRKLLTGLIGAGGPAMERRPWSPFLILNWANPEVVREISGCGAVVADKVEQAGETWSLWQMVPDLEWDWSRFEHTDELANVSQDGAGAQQHEAALAGCKVLVTGTLPTLSRKQAEARIEELGGTVASSVTKSLDLLVAGEKAGSKLTKAESLGIEVMSGATFEELGS